MTLEQLLARIAQIEQVQNKFVGMVGNDVKQLAGAISQLTQANAALMAKCVALEQAVKVLASRPAPTNGHAAGAPTPAEVPSIYAGLTSGGGAPLADMNEEDAQIMLTGGED